MDNESDEHLHSSHDDENEDKKKSSTFRKRRLSLPKHQLQPSSPTKEPPLKSDNQDTKDETEEKNQSAESQNEATSPSVDEKAHTFRKRRLSLTTSSHNAVRGESSDDAHDEASSNKRQRRYSEVSSTSIKSTPERRRTKTVHADELLSADRAPPSPAIHRDNVLYTNKPLVRPGSSSSLLFQSSGDVGAEDEKQQGDSEGSDLGLQRIPRWSYRQTVAAEEEHKLPFPLEIVGTYSCHGVEPIYGDEEEEEEAWTPPQGGKPAAFAGTYQRFGIDDDSSSSDTEDSEANETSARKRPEERPTMVAKINQDRGGVAYPYGNNRRIALFAVYDGHGQGGEFVSQFALHEVQRRLEKHPDFGSNNGKALTDVFLAVDEALKDEPLIEPWYSGTTACVALLTKNILTLANAGDSRAVMARKTAEGSSWDAVDLTIDQNPDLPEEMERITAQGGYVSPAPAPGLSARVWLDPHYTQIGLAMARSIGDHAVSEVGVIAEPVVSTYVINAHDDFMILASDGVWEFLTSADAVRIVGENFDRGATKACQALIEAAAAKWHEEEGEYRDDITAIVVKIQSLWEKDSTM
jgi:serine/threonine protein phosphatase PrpC